MLRVGILRPIDIPRPDSALMLVLGDIDLYQRRGYHFACLLQRLWEFSNYGRAEVRYPAFLFVVKGKYKIASPILGVWWATIKTGLDNHETNCFEGAGLLQTAIFCLSWLYVKRDYA